MLVDFYSKSHKEGCFLTLWPRKHTYNGLIMLLSCSTHWDTHFGTSFMFVDACVQDLLTLQGSDREIYHKILQKMGHIVTKIRQ